MSHHRRWMSGLALLVMLLAAPVLAQQQPGGETPYRALYQALSPSLKLAGYTHLRPVQRITSKNPAVSAADILVSIHAASGVLEIRPTVDGRVDFPMQAALLNENPPVRSNQPRGSLSVSVSFEIDLGRGDRLPYADLAEGIDQAQRALADFEPEMAGRRVAGIEFSFPPGVDARLQISNGDQEELLVADRSGFVRLRNDPRLRDGNVMVQWTPRPLRAVPYLTSR